MSFIPHTQDELKQLNIQPGKTYTIEYINKDYYNGEETIEKVRQHLCLMTITSILALQIHMAWIRWL